MGKTRDEYLQLHWTRYPSMPAAAVKRGRVGSAISITALADFCMQNSAIKAADVLREGDLVALLGDNQVLLLAPRLSERTEGGQWEEHKDWQQFLQHVRSFFNTKSFQEVKTPVLVDCPGTEPSLDVFETEFRLGSKSRRYYLPTSPELSLKKLLAEGAEKIFEIAAVFRNGEVTPRHRPEFTMLEWYRAFSGLESIRNDCIELVNHLASVLGAVPPARVMSVTVAELFREHLDFDLRPETSAEELAALAQKHGVDVKSAAGIDDLFFLLFMEKIEFKWPGDALVFVEKYPPYQAALARIDQQGWAERFEIYWNGYELANAFHELNDPVLQRERSAQDLQKKAELGKAAVGLDERFFAALEFGLPPSAGIALGLERLYMVLRGKKDINLINRLY
jgi:lysyl-tRNA synthetase class 2